MTLKTKTNNTAAKLSSPTITKKSTPLVKEPSNSIYSYTLVTANHSDKSNGKSKDAITKLLIETIQKIFSPTDIKETIMSALSVMFMIIQNV